MYARNALVFLAAGFAAAQTTTTATETTVTTGTETATSTLTSGTTDTTVTSTFTSTGTETLTLTSTASASTLSTVSVPSNGTVTTITRVVEAYTTYCPYATTFDFNGHHYEIAGPTTLTITDCPCTITETSSCAASTPATLVPVKPTPVASSKTQKTTSSACTGDECTVVTAGSGAVQFSLGLAAAFGLLAL